jgi:hypothetical protein
MRQSPLGSPPAVRSSDGGAGAASPAADAAFQSPRSASEAKRTRYTARASLSTGAGGTELVTVRGATRRTGLTCARVHTPVPDASRQPAQTPNVTAAGEADGDEEVDAGAAGAGGGEDEEDEGVDDDGDDADANANADADAAAGVAGGEDSAEPFDAAMALLRRRLLRGEGDVELGPALQRNYRRARRAFLKKRNAPRTRAPRHADALPAAGARAANWCICSRIRCAARKTTAYCCSVRARARAVLRFAAAVVAAAPAPALSSAALPSRAARRGQDAGAAPRAGHARGAPRRRAGAGAPERAAARGRAHGAA